jgi:hypothetical protein
VICVECAAGLDCVNQQCVCNAMSCPDGCCDTAAGPCLPGNVDANCGDGGVICVACPSGQDCVNQQCVCNATSCPNGCCTNGPGNPGSCLPGNSNANCGDGGELCETCPTGETCVDGDCVCNATSCPNGCCDTAAGPCLPGTANDNCGDNGVICVACPMGQTCVDQQCVGCNATTCPNGCCDTANGPCLPGNTNADCGDNGEICVSCPMGQRCVNQECVCDATSCPNGCCTNGPGNPGTCQTSSNTTCGTQGRLCIDCPDCQECRDGSCQFDESCTEDLVRDDAPSGSGNAGVTQCQEDGFCRQTIRVNITGAPANRAFDVYIDQGHVGDLDTHIFAGTFQVNAQGNGVFQGTSDIIINDGDCPSEVDNEIVLRNGTPLQHQFITEEFEPCDDCCPAPCGGVTNCPSGQFCCADVCLTEAVYSRCDRCGARCDDDEECCDGVCVDEGDCDTLQALITPADPPQPRRKKKKKSRPRRNG